MKPIVKVSTIIVGLGLAAAVSAGEYKVEMHKVTEQGSGDSIGTVTLKDSDYGLMVIPDLEGLSPGAHGFHVHANPDCGPGSKDGKTVPGLAAGGHFDPGDSGHHEGPVGKGHKGDLPVLLVGADGTAKMPVVAPHLKTSDVKNRALMIHADGDNYSDDPKPLGGGGARVACGVIKGGS